MDPKRVLIVEPDNAFALSLASLFRDDGHATWVAASAADAVREVDARSPDLLVIRAELPDQSGFSLCARVRKDRRTTRIPIILFSSESSQEALTEHARTPAAANGYLGMPLDTAALTELAHQLLIMVEPFEVDETDVVEIDEDAEALPPVEFRIGQQERVPAPSGSEVDLAMEGALSPDAMLTTPAEPPPVPHRVLDGSLSDEDRIFLDRAFRSLSEQKAELVAESHRRRPPPRRDLLTTPEGRAQLLREDLRWREA